MCLCLCAHVHMCKCMPNHNEHCWRKLCALWICHHHCQTAVQVVCSVVASECGLARDARPLCAHKPSPLLASGIVHCCGLKHTAHPLHKPLRDVELIWHMHATCLSPRADRQPANHTHMRQPGMKVSVLSHSSANISSAWVPETSSHSSESSPCCGAMYTRASEAQAAALACNQHTIHVRKQACMGAFACCRAAAATP
jgi:hypothetical protein